MFGFNDVTSVANGYGDLGRTPFLVTTDVYVEYNLKLGSKYNLNLNLTVYNATNTKTITSYVNNPHQNSWYLSYDTLVLQGTPDGVTDWSTLRPASVYTSPAFGMWNGRNGSWSMRFGARFGF